MISRPFCPACLPCRTSLGGLRSTMCGDSKGDCERHTWMPLPPASLGGGELRFIPLVCGRSISPCCPLPFFPTAWGQQCSDTPQGRNGARSEARTGNWPLPLIPIRNRSASALMPPKQFLLQLLPLNLCKVLAKEPTALLAARIAPPHKCGMYGPGYPRQPQPIAALGLMGGGPEDAATVCQSWGGCNLQGSAVVFPSPQASLGRRDVAHHNIVPFPHPRTD